MRVWSWFRRLLFGPITPPLPWHTTVVRPQEKECTPMADTSKLVAIRAKLNTDIDALIAAGNPDQATIDSLTNEATVLDNDVVAATPPSPPPALDFSKFNASLAKLNTDAATFAADPKVTQSSIDGLQAQIDTLDGNVVAATL